MNPKEPITPVLLAGGSGSRLWPLSRDLYPKQLLALTNESTMLQNTLIRLSGLTISSPIVVCNQQHRFLVAQQMHGMGRADATIVLEPFGRSTAPAAAIAALEAVARAVNGAGAADPILLVLPSDHVIEDIPGFQQAVSVGVRLALEGRLITFGVVPNRPETGYGYIRSGEQVIAGAAFPVVQFVEKPDEKTARSFLESGSYFWNSGMFMFRASSYLAELERHASVMLQSCRQSHEGAKREGDFVWLDAKAFEHCPSDSIDCAVMEKTGTGVVIPIDVAWSDIGSWRALADMGPRDEAGNVKLGDVWELDSRNSYLRAEQRLVAAVGVENIIVVETADAVLVAAVDRVQDVKEIVASLKQAGRVESVSHRRVYRPWGSYESIGASTGWQVKCLRVTPGASLSLQMHNHREEHWTVVKGEALVTRGEEVLLLQKNQSIHIPLGEKHRLANPGVEELEIIEVQSGSYLGEDDIVRFEDLYGRLGS